jgi:hypothetical protein
VDIAAVSEEPIAKDKQENKLKRYRAKTTTFQFHNGEFSVDVVD